MPINKENTILSIDFGYEHTGPDGSQYEYKLKFMQTALGPTVQISNDPYEPILFPADMFVEVSDFLVSQGVMKSTKNTLPIPKKMSMPTPTILKKNPSPIMPRPKTAGTIPPEIIEATNEVFESIQTNGDATEDEPTEEEKAEMERMKQERLKAKAKAAAASEGKKVKKREE